MEPSNYVENNNNISSKRGGTTANVTTAFLREDQENQDF